MSEPLPERPNLEHLKKIAKSLLRAAEAGDAAARARLATLPAFARLSASARAAQPFALHDAQSVVAREYGFASWNALREDVEARTLSFDAAVDAFVRAATGGARVRAERLLALHPAIASASFETALVCADLPRVERVLQEHPERAARAGGAQAWAPLLYVCHTVAHGGRLDDLVTIARRLCALGADPNGEYHWNWHPELPRTVLWASLCAVKHLPLAEALLEAGANPTDGVSMHIAGGSGDLAALELLHRFGANVNGKPGGVPPLVYMMLWSTNPAGPRWLLDHGADPSLAWGEAGEAPLHVAARRWDVSIVEALVLRGGDVSTRRADGATPHTLAERSGQRDIAEWLLAHGATDELTPLDRFVAACARADRVGALRMLADHPSFRRELGQDHHLLLQQAAETGNVPVLETMLACGFDPSVRDKDGVTALHRAAMSGYPDAVRVLISAGAPLDALDGMFRASPLVWAVEGRNHPRPGADHVEVARRLIAAGAPVNWTAPEGAPDPERTQEALIELCRAAAV